MAVMLRVLVGSELEQEVVVRSRRFLIGRADDCDLRPTCPMVSRYHCELSVLGDRVTLRDAKSKNGTFVNGERIHGPTELHSGDLIGFGLRRLAIEISTGSQPDSQPIQLHDSHEFATAAG